MSLARAPLPTDPDALREFAAGLQAELARKDTEIAANAAEIHAKTLHIEKLKMQLAVLRRARFGRSSEKLDRDIEREAALNRDAEAMVGRLSWERDQLAQAGAGHESRISAATAAADEAAAALHEVEARLARLTDESARLAARHHSAERLVHDLRAMTTRAERAAADACAAATRASAAGEAAQAALALAEQAQAQAQGRAEAAEAALTEAEERRAAAEKDETAARAARAAAEGEAGALMAERTALSRLVDRARAGGQTMLDLVQVAPGYEAAFGAALAVVMLSVPAVKEPLYVLAVVPLGYVLAGVCLAELETDDKKHGTANRAVASLCAGIAFAGAAVLLVLALRDAASAGRFALLASAALSAGSGVIALATFAGSMLNVCASTSTKTGVAPACRMTLTVAINVSEGTITSLPGPMPQA